MDGNNWPPTKTWYCRMILLKTATNFSSNGCFPLSVKWHVTWPVRSTNSKMFRTLKPSCVLNLVPFYSFRNITNKFFSPANAFDYLSNRSSELAARLCLFSWKTNRRTLATHSYCCGKLGSNLEFIMFFKKVTTCFNFKDMFRCCQHHRQLQNIWKTVGLYNKLGETYIIN